MSGTASAASDFKPCLLSPSSSIVSRETVSPDSGSAEVASGAAGFKPRLLSFSPSIVSCETPPPDTCVPRAVSDAPNFKPCVLSLSPPIVSRETVPPNSGLAGAVSGAAIFKPCFFGKPDTRPPPIPSSALFVSRETISSISGSVRRFTARLYASARILIALRPSIVYSLMSSATPSPSVTCSRRAAFSTIRRICAGVSGSK